MKTKRRTSTKEHLQIYRSRIKCKKENQKENNYINKKKQSNIN